LLGGEAVDLKVMMTAEHIVIDPAGAWFGGVDVHVILPKMVCEVSAGARHGSATQLGEENTQYNYSNIFLMM
jgi:hypothetical protein